jgi:alcohol dehydrogenase class IV
VNAALASILVGDGTDTTGGGLTAALSHAIGHHYEAHNGAIDAILLPHVLDRIPPSGEARTWIAEGLGCAPVDTRARLEDALVTSGVHRRLRDVGVQLGDVAGLADEATADFSYRRSAHQPDRATITEVILAAW